MLPSDLTEPAAVIARHLVARGESLAVAESAAGGLISAALVAVPGASAYYRGGVVIYTLDGARALLGNGPPLPAGMRGASEPFARWLALAGVTHLGADWGVGETGASGPTGNPYGDPPGSAWVAAHGPGGEAGAQRVLTRVADRESNMVSFAAAALRLLAGALNGERISLK